MTPAIAPEAATEVVPARTVCATVEVAPLAAAASASMGYCQQRALVLKKDLDGPEQKFIPTEMMLVGSTGGLAAAHTAVEQSRTPKPKFMFLQRQT